MRWPRLLTVKTNHNTGHHDHQEYEAEKVFSRHISFWLFCSILLFLLSIVSDILWLFEVEDAVCCEGGRQGTGQDRAEGSAWSGGGRQIQEIYIEFCVCLPINPREKMITPNVPRNSNIKSPSWLMENAWKRKKRWNINLKNFSIPSNMDHLDVAFLVEPGSHDQDEDWHRDCGGRGERDATLGRPQFPTLRKKQLIFDLKQLWQAAPAPSSLPGRGCIPQKLCSPS